MWAFGKGRKRICFKKHGRGGIPLPLPMGRKRPFLLLLLPRERKSGGCDVGEGEAQEEMPPSTAKPTERRRRRYLIPTLHLASFYLLTGAAVLFFGGGMVASWFPLAFSALAAPFGPLATKKGKKKRRGGRKRNETERREEKDTKRSIGRPSLAWLLRPSLPHPFCVSFSSHFLFFFEWTLHYCYAVQHCASAATKVFLYFFLCLPLLLLLDPSPLTSSAGGSFFSRLLPIVYFSSR